jgi:protein subunit release factor A
LSLQNNIDKIFQREDTIEKLLVNSSELKPSELAELSKELSDIKHITELAKKKYLLDKELSDLNDILDDKDSDSEI